MGFVRGAPYESQKAKNTATAYSVFGKSRKSCKNLVLRRKKFTRILASLARIAPLKGGRNNFFVWDKYYNIGAAYLLISLDFYTEPKKLKEKSSKFDNLCCKFGKNHRNLLKVTDNMEQ